MTFRKSGSLFVPTRNIWVPSRKLADNRGFISPGIIGAVAGSRRRTAAAGLAKTSLIAWYDFANANDSHTGGLNLTEVGSPSYTGGPPSYGTAIAGAPDDSWTRALFGNSWFATEVDATMVLRVRGHTAMTNGDYAFVSHNVRVAVRWMTAGWKIIFGGITVDHPDDPSLNTWYTIIATYTAATHDVRVYINATDEVNTLGGTYIDGAGPAYFGGSSASISENFDIDYAGFFERVITAEERTWLYNSGGTRTYSELT